MAACETCWNDAYARSRLFGGTQVENYYALLRERDDDPAHIAEGVTPDDEVPQ